MIADYKDWITAKADEMALEKYGKEFYDLPETTQREVFSEAELAYQDYYANEIDRLFEMAKEQRLFNLRGDMGR